ncbi:hypothetical protein SeMB42_g06553, partial [Synchytrium endobioticum]
MVQLALNAQGKRAEDDLAWHGMASCDISRTKTEDTMWWWWWWKKPKDDDFEEKLSELDEAIRSLEIALSAIRIRERQALFSWLYYSLPSYLVMLLVYFKFMHPEQDKWELWLLKSAPVMVGPLIIYFVRKFISFSFGRWKNYEEMRLDNLRSRQKAMVEELKKRTKFYATKELIERYETPVKPMDGQQELDGVSGHPSRLHKPGGAGASPHNPPGLTRRKLPHDDPTPPARAPSQPNMQPIPTPITATPLNQFIDELSTPIPSSTRSDSVLYQPPARPLPSQRNWYDKIVDAVLGD